MVCTNYKNIQNIQNCIYGEGKNEQIVTSDGVGGLVYSTSLLKSTPTILAAILTQDYPIVHDTPTQLLSTNISLDVQTTGYAASIFNIFGQNISGQPIWVSVNFSISWVGAAPGVRQVWLQTSYSTERYGYVSDAGTNAGNIQCGSCVIYLPQGASASFWAFQSTNTTLSLVGGNSSVPNRSRWQTTLLN